MRSQFKNWYSTNFFIFNRLQVDLGMITVLPLFLGQEHAGGRVHSVPIDDSTCDYVELGAQWVHGENNPIYELANQEQLLSNITSEEGQGE